MRPTTDDVRIREIKELAPPSHVLRESPISERASQVTFESRQSIHRILHGMDDRLLVVIGPCSIHDTEAALEYAGRLAEQRQRFGEDLEIVMRVYFEKPRTTVGWKGLINDPDLDDSFQINKGLRTARELLLADQRDGAAGGHRVPRHDHAAVHRRPDRLGRDRRAHDRVARCTANWPRGCRCPVGFKNGTDGNLRIALDAIKAASQPHHFLSVTKGGHSAIVSTNGNEDCHVILRGGKSPNFDAASGRRGLRGGWPAPRWPAG